ncbi:glutaredoxin [Tremella mesenterica]|uniref:Glutaredoxin n=1 Tax=Tremella mesenterica TaxID=5217 RepID=A0A4Q1BIY6_TREME|nr:uncharacterized protein TREMEDRAFT_63200 [Tremella mesenterica DSM 1558]EIW68739.1 hypothetical protein TREMEDRAFT_63200 [Tremella mesenterica DSM 1558]RXK37616.1 glutaredoxin [Tremella mesenterica]
MGATVKDMVDNSIKENEFVIFGKSWCPYCKRAKAIMEDLTDQLMYIDIDKTDKESEIQAYLHQLNGQGTVPHVYIRQKFIGGCSDLQAIPGAKLKEMVKGSKAKA